MIKPIINAKTVTKTDPRESALVVKYMFHMINVVIAQKIGNPKTISAARTSFKEK